MVISNVEMAAAWDGAEGDHWAAHADRYEATAPDYWRLLLAAVPIDRDAAILDIGCGTGQSTRNVARIASSGSVVGVDLSAKMLEHARAAASAEGLLNVGFERADAQVHPFPPASSISPSASSARCSSPTPCRRSPTSPERSVQGAPGAAGVEGWNTTSGWRRSARPCHWAGRFPHPPVGAPGPFRLADRSSTQRVLTHAGFVDVGFDEVTEAIRLGDDADDAFSFVATFGITRGLTQDLDDARKAAALDALHATLVEHETDDGVLFGGPPGWFARGRGRAVELDR